MTVIDQNHAIFGRGQEHALRVAGKVLVPYLDRL
jgi:hypothetical protein